MAKYRKKPVVVDAVQNDGEWAPILAWLDSLHDGHYSVPPGGEPPITRTSDGALHIKTLEGVMTARPGWWVIRGVAGEFYPCDPDIFQATYDAVSESRPEGSE